MQIDVGPVMGDGNSARFELMCEPDGIYRVDGRVIPVADDCAQPISCVDHRKTIVRIHRLPYEGVGVLGRIAAVDVEK